MKNPKLHQLRNETDSRNPAAYSFFFLLPFLFFLIFFLVIRKNPLDFHLVFSDELDYWAEAATLTKQGLFSSNAGYFGYSYANHARFLYFGAHGFFSLIPYALFGIVAPDVQVTVLVLNALFMGISLSAAYYLTGSFSKTLAITLPLFAFYPFYLYYQTGMLETLFYAGSIFLAVLCAKCFTPGVRKRTYLKLYFWLVILFSLFRLSNFVLIIPALFLEFDLKKQTIFYILLKYGVAAVSVALLSVVFAATYPWGFLGELAKSNDILGLILGHTVSNLKLLFDLNAGYALEILPRFLFFSWLIFLCIYYIATKKHNAREANYLLLSQLFALLALLLLIITLYDVNSFRDLRVFSPILVYSIIVFYFSDQYKNSGKWIFALTMIYLIASNYVVIKERNLFWDLTITQRYKAANPPGILKDVQYNPDAKTRWENTAYVDLGAYGSLDWKNYSPGIGMMVLGPEEVEELKFTGSGSQPTAKYIISVGPLQVSGYELTKTEQNVYLYFQD